VLGFQESRTRERRDEGSITTREMIEEIVGSTLGKIYDPCNRCLKGKFRSSTRIGAHLEAPLKMLF
jgi:hypothetical protein